MHDHLIDYLRSALAEAANDHFTFQLLTDEEIAAIDQGHESELALHPWIDAQDDIDLSICARFGERSLFLRGLLEASLGVEDGKSVLTVSDELQLIADARRLGAGHVMMRATYDGTTSGRYLVLQEAVGGFEEAVDADGLHLFTGCTYPAAIARLAEWALPAAEHSGVRMRTRVPVDRWQAWIINELGIDVRLIDVKVFLPGSDGSMTADSYLLAHAHDIGVLATSADSATFEVSSITRSHFADRLGEQISAALRIEL